MIDVCPISGESEQEELFNSITHFFGLLLSFIGFIYLVRLSLQAADEWALISSSIYGATLTLLYAASTYYHSCKTLKLKQTFQIVDHACIYLLIAGSYTPFTLGPLREYGGWNLMAIEWTIAGLGIIMKIVAGDKFKVISLLAYLAMGWLVVFSFNDLLEQIPMQALVWLIVGGLSYTLGTLFYVWDNLPYNHGIWHLFVLFGSISHYFCILKLI